VSAAEPVRTPEQIEAEIEQTRARLGDTVEALAAKTDVKAQAAERVGAAKESMKHKTEGFVAKAREVTPDSAGAAAQQAALTVQRRPLPFSALGGFVAGMLVGWRLARR
jgi:hypothetical protein